jgi:hypothetical protein
MSENPAFEAEIIKPFATVNKDESKGRFEARAGLAEVVAGKEDEIKFHGKLLTAGYAG